MNTLDDSVLDEIARLGGVVGDLAQARTPRFLAGRTVPEPLRQLLTAITWPTGVTFSNGDDADWPVWLFEFHTSPPSEAFAAHHPEMMGFAFSDGGNLQWLIALDDGYPAEPRVYRLDHDSDPTDDPMSFGRLTGFLAELRPQEPK